MAITKRNALTLQPLKELGSYIRPLPCILESMQDSWVSMRLLLSMIPLNQLPIVLGSCPNLLLII